MNKSKRETVLEDRNDIKNYKREANMGTRGQKVIQVNRKYVRI